MNTHQDDTARENLVLDLYSVRSILIQINYKSAEYMQSDLTSYSDTAIKKINEIILKVTHHEASRQRWPNTCINETYNLKTDK